MKIVFVAVASSAGCIFSLATFYIVLVTFNDNALMAFWTAFAIVHVTILCTGKVLQEFLTKKH